VLKVNGIPTPGLTAERAYIFTVGRDRSTLQLQVRRLDALIYNTMIINIDEVCNTNMIVNADKGYIMTM
jgi:hypothetical protein